jgi:uracil-DNA glycosylase
MSDPKYKHIGHPLTRVMEECSEVIKAACKIERFGLYSYHPDDLNKNTNFNKLKAEMADVVEAWNDFMQEVKDKENDEA